ncbi:hypothetical protein COL516b_005073 [Colletotrichum fioriniae]|nr:uncharacterized protein COL516b_005073 [Colletotrichum fioriniae]KAJ0305962.1 hypothetical protein COL516b_005073 [Colletotrichum fioriniae]
MPRRRDPSKQVSRRSHRGCHRCRLHKIRCDEAKPHCGPCTSRGYADCVYAQVLKWETDYVGRAFGRAGVWSKSGTGGNNKKKSATPPSTLDNYWCLPTHVHSFGFLNSFITDFEREESSSSSIIRSLRLTLGNKSSIDIAANSEILVLMMLLCQLEIIAECDKRWVTHLRGARDLIRFRRQGMTSDAAKMAARQQSPWERIIKFTERYFAFYDVMGRTACGEEPIFGNDFWSAQEDEGLDLWMGCSPQLVSIIGEITELSFKYHRMSSSTAEDCWQDLERQRIRLTCLLQQPHLKSDSEDEIIRNTVELKRLTVELYLHSALNDSTPATPVIRHNVKKILRLVAMLLEADVKAGLTWPLFMAACQLDPTEELEWAEGDVEDKTSPRYARPFVLYVLDKLADSLSNVTRTRSVIEKVWKQREAASFLSSDRQLSPSPKAFNDWARFVAPFCHNISLA